MALRPVAPVPPQSLTRRGRAQVYAHLPAHAQNEAARNDFVAADKDDDGAQRMRRPGHTAMTSTRRAPC